MLIESISSAITVAAILHILLVFATGLKGAQKIGLSGNLGYVIDASAQHPTASQVLQHAFLNALPVLELPKECLTSFLETLCRRMDVCGHEQRRNLMSLLEGLIARIPSGVCVRLCFISPSYILTTSLFFPSKHEWVSTVYSTIKEVICSGPSHEEHRCCTMVTASLLHAYPRGLLFKTCSRPETLDPEKPFIYLFLQLVTIDLRATFSSLMEQLTSPAYGATILRLAAGFDIIAAFLDFLMDVEDFKSVGIAPDLLLKLRKDIGETFGYTIEFLRDRWDAVYAGAAGLEHGYEKDLPKELAWDSLLDGGLEKDVLIVGAVRALSRWVRDDEELRKEASGLMDVFLGLWQKGMEAGVDYRPWIVGALQGVLEEVHGRAMFMEQKGWRLLWDDLKAICYSDPDDEELHLAAEEAKLLATFVRVEIFVNEAWTREVVAAADFQPRCGLRMHLEVTMLNLASACISSALISSTGAYFEGELEKLRCGFERLQTAASHEPELTEILTDVARELKLESG
jgi:hypothetical protein